MNTLETCNHPYSCTCRDRQQHLCICGLTHATGKHITNTSVDMSSHTHNRYFSFNHIPRQHIHKFMYSHKYFSNKENRCRYTIIHTHTQTQNSHTPQTTSAKSHTLTGAHTGEAGATVHAPQGHTRVHIHARCRPTNPEPLLQRLAPRQAHGAPHRIPDTPFQGRTAIPPLVPHTRQHIQPSLLGL